MNILIIIFLVIAAVGFISLYRNDFDVKKAWEAVTTLVIGLIAAFAAWWQGSGGLPS